MGSLAIDRTITELMNGAHVELFAGKVFEGDGKTHWQPVFYIVNYGVFHRTHDRIVEQLLKDKIIVPATQPWKWVTKEARND